MAYIIQFMVHIIKFVLVIFLVYLYAMKRLLIITLLLTACIAVRAQTYTAPGVPSGTASTTLTQRTKAGTSDTTRLFWFGYNGNQFFQFYSAYQIDKGFLPLFLTANTTVNNQGHTLYVKSLSTTQPTFIVQGANTAGPVQEWHDGSDAVVGSVSNIGWFGGFAFANKNGSANALVQTNNIGTIISRNIADANPILRIAQPNDASTGDFLQGYDNANTKFRITRSGGVILPFLPDTTTGYKALVIDVNGKLQRAPYGAGGSDSTLYKADGKILTNRFVNAQDHLLEFHGANGADTSYMDYEYDYFSYVASNTSLNQQGDVYVSKDQTELANLDNTHHVLSHIGTQTLISGGRGIPFASVGITDSLSREKKITLSTVNPGDGIAVLDSRDTVGYRYRMSGSASDTSYYKNGRKYDSWLPAWGAVKSRIDSAIATGALVDGNGTTVTGNQVDLGGILQNNSTINLNGNNVVLSDYTGGYGGFTAVSSVNPSSTRDSANYAQISVSPTGFDIISNKDISHKLSVFIEPIPRSGFNSSFQISDQITHNGIEITGINHAQYRNNSLVNKAYTDSTAKFKADSVKGTITGGVTSVSGTTNRITSTGGTTPVIDISSTFEASLGKVANPLSQFASTTSSQLAGVISDETGSGGLVFGTSPTLVTPVLGTPTSVTLTNATGLPNAGLVNSTISGVSLGSNLNTLTFGTHLTSGGSSYNGSAGVTITSDATSAATAGTIAAKDANGNTTINNLIENGQSIATAAGTTTFTVASPKRTVFTGTTTQTVLLPVASTLSQYQVFQVKNSSTGAVTVNSSGGNLVQTIAGGGAATFTCILTSGTSAASWWVDYLGSFTSGSVIFAGSTGALSQNNSGLFFNNTNNWLGINTAVPTSLLNVNQSSGNTGGLQITGVGVAGGSGSTAGVGIYLGFNATSNRQMWMGATDALGSSTLGIFRYITGTTGYAGIDAISGNGSNRLPVVLGTETSAVSVGYATSSGPDLTKMTGKLNVFNLDDAITTLKLQHVGTASGLFMDLQNSSSSSLFSISNANLWALSGTNGTANQVPVVNAGGTAMTWGNVSFTSSSADLTAQTTAGNVTTFTVGASTATFNISSYINVTAVSVDVIQGQITYTDENNTAQTVSLASLSAIGNSTYSPITIRAKNATVITVKTNLTTGAGSITFDTGARITQL